MKQPFAPTYILFAAVLSAALICGAGEVEAQHFRTSVGYSVKSVSLNYVPNPNYTGNIGGVVKGVVEAEFERYLFYRFYLAGKAEYLLHNREDVLFGGPVNFDQAELSGVLGLQWPKWGAYAGVKGGRIWDLSILSKSYQGEAEWLPPKQFDADYTTALTGGIKYYVFNFLRFQAEINYGLQQPSNIIPQEKVNRNPAFRSFDFNPVSFSVGVSISIPWTSRKQAKKYNSPQKLPPLMRISGVNFERPIKSDTYVTSPFGERWNRPHQGVDLNAGFRDKIVAAESGVVTVAGTGRGYGKMVKIKHAKGFETVYAHMMKIRVKKGERVRKGQVIGEAGNTGTSTGVHLHFEVIKNGKHEDPVKYVRF